MIELTQLFDHDHDILAGRGTGERQSDKVAVLETVQDEQAVLGLFEAECCIKLGFGTGLEPKIITGAFTQIFLDHGPILVDLHRKHTQVSALVFKFFDRFSECGLQFADLAEDQLRKPEQDRRVDAALLKVVNDLLDIGRKVVVLRSPNDQITLSIDGEIICSPISDAIGFGCLINYCAQIRITPVLKMANPILNKNN